jgi:hypothetical protein
VVVVASEDADFPDDPHPARNTTTTPTTHHRRNIRRRYAAPNPNWRHETTDSLVS